MENEFHIYVCRTSFVSSPVIWLSNLGFSVMQTDGILKMQKWCVYLQLAPCMPTKFLGEGRIIAPPPKKKKLCFSFFDSVLVRFSVGSLSSQHFIMGRDMINTETRCLSMIITTNMPYLVMVSWWIMESGCQTDVILVVFPVSASSENSCGESVSASDSRCDMQTSVVHQSIR